MIKPDDMDYSEGAWQGAIRPIFALRMIALVQANSFWGYQRVKSVHIVDLHPLTKLVTY